MFELIIAIVLGILIGTITGLIPGLHTNTVALIVVGSSASFLVWFSPLALAAFLVAMIVIHSFVDFIPSIFLGAPEGATVLSILPGHELLLNGEGFRALKLTIVGGIGTFVLGLAIIPFMFLFLEQVYEILINLIAPLLIIFSILFILQERKLMKIFWSVIVFLLAGSLGYIVLNQIQINEPLFPMLSGLFGISTLFFGMLSKNKIVEQNLDAKVVWLSKRRFFDYIKAAFSSLFVSIMPAIGAAQAAIISRAFTKFKDKEDFLVVLGGINTAATLFTLTTLFIIAKARTGVVVAINEIITLTFKDYLILLLVCFVALIFSVFITLKLGRLAAKYISKINYRQISLGIILFICMLVFILSGLIGLWILFISSAIGMLAPLIGIKRIHLMACLIVPVVIYFM